MAADQGDAEAQSNLGMLYARGQGVPQDDAEAAKWWRMAADRGDVYQQFNLGVMYENGQGVPKDYVQAHKWFELAAVQGDSEARKRMDLVAEKMTPAQIAEAIRLAREWKPKGRD
jgi:TPR repeat protein